MDYEKKYKEAIKKAKKDLDVCEQDCLVAKQIFRYFPELAMSEDEKIKKEIIEYVKNTPVAPEGHIEQRVLSRWLAWLEKQNSNVDNANKEYWRGYREGKQEILDKYAELKKQGEQKPVFEMITPEESLGIDSDTYNKIVDECVYGKQKPAEWHREDEQNLNACLGYIPDEFLRRWLKDVIHVKYDKSAWSEEDSAMTEVAINLAHESDVLAEIERIINRRLNLLQGEYFNLEEETKDMTNELVDTLCSIEPTIEALRTEYEKGKADAIAEIQKDWSEEDERIRKGIIRNLEYLLDRAEGFVKDELKERIVWLESLRPQNTWKPTIAQVKAVEEALNDAGYTYDDLKSLYDDLKKL